MSWAEWFWMSGILFGAASAGDAWRRSDGWVFFLSGVYVVWTCYLVAVYVLHRCRVEEGYETLRRLKQ